MNKIVLENLSKRFQNEWIFKNLSYEFKSGDSYAILGLNGSGKSTLLQCISGLLSPSKGSIKYFDYENEILMDNVYNSISLSAPYQELIEEFSLIQLLDFHQKFKKFKNGYNSESILKILRLQDKKDHLLRTFSSGMKQRVKLALAILTESDVLMLDEPTSNLDAENKIWFLNLLKENTEKRILIICSNHIKEEYDMCRNVLEMSDFK